MIMSILSGVIIPATFTAVSLTITGVSYRTGLVCLPNHKHAILTFWAWQVGFAGAALLVQGITTWYCIWVYLRVLVRSRRGRRRSAVAAATASNGGRVEHSSFVSESTTGSGAARPQNTWRKMRRMLLLQWRGVALTVVMAVESLFYIIVFVAQDTRFGEVAGKANEPDAKTWSACLVLTAGNREACMQYTNKLAISQDLVLGSLLLGSVSTSCPLPHVTFSLPSPNHFPATFSTQSTLTTQPFSAHRHSKLPPPRPSQHLRRLVGALP